MKKCRLFFLLLVVISGGINVYAQQYQIKGKVIGNSSNKPVEFVNAMLMKKDSVYSGAVTDSLGGFIITAPKGDYTLKLEQFSQVFLSKDISLYKDLDLGILPIEQFITLSEIVIEASSKKQYSDRAIYSFDKETLEKARYAKDLLVSLPELQLDPISQAVNSTRGGKVLFLVNGIEATDNQIKSIAPTHVKRVIYYDIPPTRWANRANIVVNIITQNPEVGYSYGAEVFSAFTTGFVNGFAYADYTKGNNSFGLEYKINVRNYNNRQNENTYTYQLNNKKYHILNHQKDHFGYTNQDIALRYTRTIPDDYTFQIKFTITPFSNFLDGEGKSLFQEGNTKTNHQSIQEGNSKYTNPTLDIYYSKNLGEKDELIFNIIGSHYKTQSTRLKREWNIATNTNVFNDNMNLETTQTGIVGEIAHTHKFEKGQLNSGYLIQNTAISNNLKNLLGNSQYDVNYLEQYLYTEYSSKWKNLNYRLSMGLTNINNKSAVETANYWIPNPKIVLSYSLMKNHTLRLYSQYNTNNPSGAELSPNVIQVAPNLVSSGNPYLKPSNKWSNDLIYSYYNKYFDINMSAFYEYTNNPIISLYTYNSTQNYYNLKSVNSKHYKEYGLNFIGRVKPFGNNLLSIKAIIAPIYQSILLSNNNELKNMRWSNIFTINSAYKNFNLQYQFNIPTYSLKGLFLSTNENKSHLFVGYKKDSWYFSAGMYWIGMPSKYDTKTIEESLVNYTSHTEIFNNKNMFVLGLSYDFSSGKKLQMKKKLNNRPTDAVTF
ncbi:TonB-dependent receptor [Riemerella anatipestifer]|uniref:outer membrane beta-barrel protein n=1 Tax=Riemerella anatipestifer TaxID=34085 RepID=UPI001AD66761|nr:outer membrane beta-barrel protein [Riemerella anatipestifer]MBO4232982.1 TonB-dependent receptor [Riemerella anatipestifer]